MSETDDRIKAVLVPDRQLFEWDRITLSSTSPSPELQTELTRAVSAIRNVQSVLISEIDRLTKGLSAAKAECDHERQRADRQRRRQ